MRAFTGLGRQREAAAFLRWLLHATALTQPRLGVVYDVFGRANLSEWEVENLSGYRASKPVRVRSEEHTSELQSLMRISYAVFCLQKQNIDNISNITH